MKKKLIAVILVMFLAFTYTNIKTTNISAVKKPVKKVYYNKDKSIKGIKIWYYNKKGKVSKVVTYNNYYLDNYKKRQTVKYKVNGKRSYYEILYRNNDHEKTKVVKYYYNKYGKLRSTKKTKAKRRSYYYYANVKYKVVYHNYTKKGKLKYHKTTKHNSSFRNCTKLREVYPDGVPSSHPAYQPKLDRDKDGWACETSSWSRG